MRIFLHYITEKQNRNTIFFVHFSIQNKAQNLRTSKFENFSLLKSTQHYIQIRHFVVVLYCIYWMLFDIEEGKQESS